MSMILKHNVNPDNLIYYKSAFVLKVLLKENRITIDKLYSTLNEENGIDYGLLLKCLDWLYLIDAVTLQEEKGELLCLLKS